MTRFWRIACLSALALAGLLDAAAGAPARSLRFENLVQRQSTVPTNTVASLEQDSQGFIWMGTQGGLYRYDGYHSTIFRHDAADPRSLPGDHVGAMLRDRQQRMWFGTSNGLARYDPASGDFTVYHPKEPAGVAHVSTFVRRIISDGKDGLWLGTARGLMHFDPASGAFEIYRHDAGRPDSLASDQVLALALDARGGLWLGGPLVGLSYLAPGSQSFRHFRIDDPARPDVRLNTVNALQFDLQQRLWIGTGKGVLKWQPESDWQTRKSLPPPDGFSEFSVYTFYQDGHANMWVGTQPTGLLQWDPAAGKFASYRHSPGDSHSLPSNRISAMLLDRSGTFWVGTWDNGVSRVDLASRGFERFIPAADGSADPLSGNVIGSLSRAGPGRLWLGAPGGVRLFDIASHRVIRHYRHDPAKPGTLSNNFVISVLQQPGGPLWVGTSTGLNRLDTPDGEFREIRFPIKSTNFIRKIVPSRDGSLWIASDGGLLRFDPRTEQATAFLHDPQDPGSRGTSSANAALEDRRGRLWVGSPYGFGLDMMMPGSGKFTRHRADLKRRDSLSNDFVTSLYEDDKGGIWVGTAGGLNQVIEEPDGSIRFRTFGAKDGLSSSDIFAIRSDRRGMLWMSVRGGMARLDPATGIVTNFFASDGITDGNFVADASLIGEDGTLYFAGFRGMTAVRPEEVRSNTIPARVAVTDLSVQNRSLRLLPHPEKIDLQGTVTDPRHLRLPWNRAIFSIEFTALHFADPERNRYAYRLEGFDRSWIDTDASHRYATYTNLDPGEYVFRVKAANKNGIWEEAGLALPVTILPPFWATWWFRLLAALFVLASLVLLFRWRVRRLEKNQARLELLVDERTLELASKNAALSEAYVALENLSVTDPLTGLHNRRFLDQKLPDDVALALRRHESAGPAAPLDAALIFFLIDLDYFKTVNDRYGHAAGDQVLLQIRQRLELVFRETDYLVRWGGEEFLVVAREANPANASEIADRVRAVVAESEFLLDEGLSIRQSCSIGFACFPFSESQPRLLTWQQVVKLADLAMYAAKRSGRSAWVGMMCGADELSQQQVEQMLQAPDAAVRDGSLKVSASTTRELLMAAWESLPEK